MAQIIKDITVDVARKNLFQAIVAKQNDSNSRFLKVTLCNEGVKIDVPPTATVMINAERADDTAATYMGVVNDDGTVTVPLTSWMLALDDVVRCSISVIVDEQKLTSTSFSIEVEAAEISDTDIIDDRNYDVLIRLISDVSEVKLECESATDNAIAATSAARRATENAITATTAANEATENANTATTSANEATKDANDAAVAANTAKNGADGATQNAIIAAERAEAAAQVVENGIDGILVKDTDNNLTYIAKFRLIGGKPAIEYTEF